MPAIDVQESVNLRHLSLAGSLVLAPRAGGELIALVADEPRSVLDGIGDYADDEAV